VSAAVPDDGENDADGFVVGEARALRLRLTFGGSG
jgi:hypothetical protein